MYDPVVRTRSAIGGLSLTLFLFFPDSMGTRTPDTRRRRLRLAIDRHTANVPISWLAPPQTPTRPKNLTSSGGVPARLGLKRCVWQKLCILVRSLKPQAKAVKTAVSSLAPPGEC